MICVYLAAMTRTATSTVRTSARNAEGAFTGRERSDGELWFPGWGTDAGRSAQKHMKTTRLHS